MSRSSSTSSSSSLPFGLTHILRPLSRSIANTRLKSNLFALFLFSLRGVFPPYTALRKGLIILCDGLQGRKGRESSWADLGLYLVELITTAILLFNILEAVVAIQYPASVPEPEPKNKSGLIMTPLKVSSPLTRAYSPVKSATASSSSSSSTPNSGSLSQSQSQSLQKSLFRPSPSAATFQAQPQSQRQPQQTQSPSQTQLQSQNQGQGQGQGFQTPTRSTQGAHPLSTSTSRPANASPISSSTAKILNLNQGQTASPTKSQGLFFDKSQSQNQNQNQSQSQSVGGDFVLVDREEKEWVDNVWKGVRGKGGKVGL